ncbi:MAG: 23S rRNA (uracil(1939)-C(5))-methyltransferase RlmD [Candidatus Latescibacterota bacterium]|nr:23S rRNA (uracil(1939)-C(5))-methyltransferase RlmD [Candidatus Latescibacterota bacterium]
MNEESAKPRQGNVVEFNVERLNGKGIGVGTYSGYEVAVRGAIPGDRVRAILRRVKNRRREGEARIVERVGEKVARIDPSCAHFGVCGGCLWQDLAYLDQVELKEQLVRNVMNPNASVEIGVTLLAPESYRYRNKMEFSIGQNAEGQIEIGLHPSGQFGHIFDLEECKLMREEMSDIVEDVRCFAQENGLSAYDLRTHEGLLRFLTLREGTSTGEVMVVITTSGEPFEKIGALAHRLCERFPVIKSVMHTINREKAQIAYGDEGVIVLGDSTIQEHLGDFTFEVSSSSFFQPNVKQADKMFARIVSLCELTGSESVLDAYCGTGGISLCLSQHVKRVVGVEMSEAAIKDASINSAANGVDNVRFVAGPAENLLGQLCKQGDRFDVAVTDPPRSGMHHKATRGLIDLQPTRIVYVSCNPTALAADVAIFEAHGYELNYLQLVDMLPQTPHCEVLARLDKVA